MPAYQQNETEFERATYAKVTWRLLPLLFACYIVAYLDRVNVSFAKLQMLGDLHLSDAVFGLGAGIFFIGYFLFEIPSNLLLHRVGARLWIARIMITWGVVSAAMMFVSTPISFYITRFLLGAAEAGFFPGVVLYLTYWYPAHRRAAVMTLFMTAVPLSGVIGGPMSGWIMQTMPGVYGLAGWQWMFLGEALPSILVGLLVIVFLQDRIAQAVWLTDSEKQLLAQRIAEDNGAKEHVPLAVMFANPRVWLMAAIYFCLVMGLYGVGFWLPTLIKAGGVQGNLQIGLLSAIPYIAATLVMIPVGRSADRRREHRWHVAIPAFAGCIGLILSTVYADNTWLAMAALTLATVCIITSLPLFWSLPTAFLGGVAAAAGIALINSLGNLAGFVSPYLVGWLKDSTHSTTWGMLALAGFLLFGALLALTVPSHIEKRIKP
ncbi:MAG TPA: MFS transporter [Burkholderiaceae bacterium]